MIKNQIGENAGKVWHILKENENMGLDELKKAVKKEMNENSLLLSLGWLAREGKVMLDIADNGMLVGLICE